MQIVENAARDRQNLHLASNLAENHTASSFTSRTSRNERDMASPWRKSREIELEAFLQSDHFAYAYMKL